MKINQEVLDEFGKILIESVFDDQFQFIKNDTSDLAETEEYKNLFSGMTEIQKREIEHYTKEVLSGTLFNLLRIFEEHENFKLIYEEGSKQVDLNQISEMLKAEPIIEGGWIERFSKELK